MKVDCTVEGEGGWEGGVGGCLGARKVSRGRELGFEMIGLWRAICVGEWNRGGSVA